MLNERDKFVVKYLIEAALKSEGKEKNAMVQIRLDLNKELVKNDFETIPEEQIKSYVFGLISKI